MSDLTDPPIAWVDVAREILHGIALVDPYRWTEAGGEESHHWLDGQARPARAHLDALPATVHPGVCRMAYSQHSSGRCSHQRMLRCRLWRISRRLAGCAFGDGVIGGCHGWVVAGR
ncbi:hypothetical protein AB0K12_20365 [Nonomuraea sp. NPDC049419]|uniref:hypothetical protein n=1 Tax=Nonomuraea sp. NPDC049419 TaxID=3155772 RepID=UPI00342A6DB0